MPNHQPWGPLPILIGGPCFTLYHLSPGKLVHGGGTHTDRSSLRDRDPSTAELPFMPKREKPVSSQGYTVQGPLLMSGLRRKDPKFMSIRPW